MTCRVVSDPEAYERMMTEQAHYDAALDNLEDACPQLFEPRRPLTEHSGQEWKRLYMNTDLTAWIVNGEVRFNDSIRADQPVYLGRASDWEKAPLPLVCGRRDSHYFARLAPAGAR